MRSSLSRSSVLFGFLLGVPAAAAAQPRGPDFNNDGKLDLVAGAPGQNLAFMGNAVNAGAAYLYLGQSDGTYAPSQVLSQETAGVPGVPHAGEELGQSVAWGNFDGDDFDDFAVGVLYDVQGDVGIGAVEVFYGAAGGLDLSRTKLIHRDTPGISGSGHAGDRFGFAVAAGDFDGDGFDDLAVGAPGPDGYNGGSVQVIYGGTSGLQTDDQILVGPAATPDWFGRSLASGDFDCDGNEDLAIGASNAQVSGKSQAGAVYIAYSNGTELQSNYQVWTEDTAGVQDTAETQDWFGFALAAGNFNNDLLAGRPCIDLAIGSPGELWNGEAQAGVVHVLRGGSQTGLRTTGNLMIHQDIGGVEGASEAEDRFGNALTVMRTNNDSFDDLVVGVPGENGWAGAIQLFPGSASLLGVGDDLLWTQDSSNNGVSIPNTEEPGDSFGWGLGGGPRTLAVGAPSEWLSVSGLSVDSTGTTAFLTFQTSSQVLLRGAVGDLINSSLMTTRRYLGRSLTGARPGFVP